MKMQCVQVFTAASFSIHAPRIQFGRKMLEWRLEKETNFILPRSSLSHELDERPANMMQLCHSPTSLAKGLLKRFTIKKRIIPFAFELSINNQASRKAADTFTDIIHLPESTSFKHENVPAAI